MAKKHSAELRAGVFTLLLLMGFAAMIFILGSRKGYFRPQITLTAKFLNVYGLQVGAPVRYMGVGIGHVTDIILPNQSLHPEIEVIFQIDKSAKKNITKDSVATIKWLSYVTGDSYVEIAAGAHHEPEVKDGDTIKSAEPLDYTSALENSIRVVESFSNILKKIEKGKLVESFNAISASLHENLNALQKSDGLLHALIYDQKGKQLLDNLTTTSESLKGIVTEIEEGEGTLGALITDPTIYESLNSLLGGAERSFILRTLIRKSIEKGGRGK
ncbi:MAG: MCE family protein [wastewater metagenome]|nr:MCE family protein [Candidatus Loosdrechtia aerotolerans]